MLKSKSNKTIVFLLLLVFSCIYNIPFINAANELSPTELLGNPGFEGTYTIVASSWQNISSNIAINCSKDTNNPHGGSASQKISIPVASNFVTNAAMFGQKFTPFKGATTYEGSVWLKSSDGATVRFSLLAEGNWTDPGAVQLVKLTPTWTKYTIRGGWDTNKIGYFGFYFISSGTVWMDDASLREVINDDNVVTQNTIPETFFGMHVTHCFDPRPSYRYNTWPANLQFKYLRLWDTLVTWMDIEPTKGNWNWTTFDLYVSTAVQYNKEIIYTLGRIPAWASSKPTDPKPTIAAPQNIGDWRNYVRTVATRYKGKIKYWEMWNETNTQSFYTGTTEKMLEMTIAAREELKAVDPNNIILSPNVVNGDEWLDKFLYLGGGQYVDIISIHRYSSYTPEQELPYVAAVKNVMEHHGIGNKPIWDTEGATWGAPPSTSDAVGALARMYILRWAWGIKFFCWYGWDLDVGNPLSQTGKILPTAAGIAYGEVVKWLRGNQMMNIQHDANGTWIVDVKNADGSLSYIVWNQNGTRTFNIPVNWSIQKKKDLSGLTTSVSPGSSISIGVSPILLTANTPIQDTIAPVQITSLAIVNVTTTTITLSWTSVGDDGTMGTATSYDIRYRIDTLITASNWGSATQCTNEPLPKAAGYNENFIISNLSTNTTYYFAIKTRDEIPNWSGISNIVSGKTLMGITTKAQWHFDEGTGTITQDTSGNNNTGTLTNGPIWIDGKSGKAVKFDGVNDFISVLNSASLNMGTQDFTITAWANFDELTTARHGIIAKITGDATNGPAMGYGYMIHVHNNKFLRFSVTGGVNIYRFAQYALTGANVTGWHFVTGLWNAATNTAKLYLDGLEVASNSYTSGTVGNIDNTNNLAIGSTYKGILDEVYIWNRALSVSEILAEYNSGLPDTTAPSQITNLSMSNLTTTSITLNWTSVGDDGTTGIATIYDIRYTTYSIITSNWSNTTQCTGEPTPQVSGTNQAFAVTNLIANTTYYFAIKTGDESGNQSNISNVVSAKTIDAGSTVGLVGEWKFEEGSGTTANDTSGNSNKGTLVNSPAWVTGKVGKALEFNGTNKYVSINNTSSLNIKNAITLEALVKTDVITQDGGPTRRVIDKGVYLLAASDKSYIKIYIGGVGKSVEKAWTVIDIGKWHHIVGTYDSAGGTNNLKLYQDGILVAQTTVTGNIDTNTSILNIGRQGITTGRFDGMIDEVRVYNRALSSSEVSSRYTKFLLNYGVFGVAAINLENAHVYPNSYKSSAGHTNIKFADLTSHTKVQIFNIIGELVYEDEKDTPFGELVWDVKNSIGEPIASGVYIYMITNNNGQTKKGKLAIIR